ncbi:hypothetical protein [Robiginitalea sp. SC105]|uniref:hypothetical protein n=1 Tax=Robiginitalea sp. SC105 TaxID=2762332 RepID=UPI00163B031F|nr:hypothetical protein [Robiginitalea sp. SC105]MBC2839809.1 hypothetical protein [Robiginitalea sp. SC105]
MRLTRFLFAFALMTALFTACKGEKEVAPANPWTTAYAGQYLIRDGGTPSRTVSERYILTPGGDAELHRLERPGIYGEYRLDKIVRGSWQAREGRIDILLGESPDQQQESYSLRMRPAAKDSLLTDTLWVNGGEPERTLQLLIRF